MDLKKVLIALALGTSVLVVGCDDDDDGGSTTGIDLNVDCADAANPDPLPSDDAAHPDVGRRG